MSLVKYEILLNALKYGSITAAAEQMGYTQSGVSHMLNSLEDELGVKLIVRNKKGVSLTSSGEILLPYIKKVVSENEAFLQAVSEVNDVLRGQLTIGSFGTVSSHYLPHLIRDFNKEYPNVSFRIVHGNYGEIEHWIETRQVDCGFVSLPTRDSFTTIPALQDRLVAIVGKDYPHHFPKDRKVSLEEIARQDMVLMEDDSDYDLTLLFKGTPYHWKPKVVVGDNNAALKMVEHDMGVCIFPITYLSDLSEFIEVYEIDTDFTRTVALAYTGLKEASPVMKRFVQFIEERGSMSFAAFNHIKAVNDPD
ncbi:MAG: LysR family transcriptional regulator [Firmicutes bacterium]|nr:LysR family transcriptional regulator [Bacillota bacterium]